MKNAPMKLYVFWEQIYTFELARAPPSTKDLSPLGLLVLDLVDYLEKCTFWVPRSKFDGMDGAKTVAKKLISRRGEIQLVH